MASPRTRQYGLFADHCMVLQRRGRVWNTSFFRFSPSGKGVKFLVGRTLGFLKGMGYVIGFPDPLSSKTCWKSWRRRFGHFFFNDFEIAKAWILRFVCKNMFVSFRSDISIKRRPQFYCFCWPIIWALEKKQTLWNHDPPNRCTQTMGLKEYTPRNKLLQNFLVGRIQLLFGGVSAYFQGCNRVTLEKHHKHHGHRLMRQNIDTTILLTSGGSLLDVRRIEPSNCSPLVPTVPDLFPSKVASENIVLNTVLMLSFHHTVDGKKSCTSWGWYFILSFTGFYTSQVVQDSLHLLSWRFFGELKYIMEVSLISRNPPAYLYICMLFIQTHIHTYIHTYIHTCMHACMHASMHTCIHAYMHTCIHAYIHFFNIWKRYELSVIFCLQRVSQYQTNSEKKKKKIRASQPENPNPNDKSRKKASRDSRCNCEPRFIAFMILMMYLSLCF